MNFELVQTVKILFGCGRVRETGGLMNLLGLKNAFVVCDSGVVRAGIVSRVTESLSAAGCNYFLYDKVVADPPAGIIDAGAALCTAHHCDGVIAVGGGSSIDTAKGINLLRCHPGQIMDYTDPAMPVHKTDHLIVIPTTSGTGSELSDGLVVTGTDHVKHPILAADASVNHAVLDPELMTGMPPQLTASTGMDALAHSVEAYTSTAATMVSDQICEGNIAAVLHWLPFAVSDGGNLEARGHMALASAIGGWMLRYGHTHAGHSVAHVIGARCRIPHGLACAFSLPWVVEFNAPQIPEKTRRVGELFGVSFTGRESAEETGRLTREAILRFRDEKLSLRPAKEFLSRPEDLPSMAEEIEKELFQAFNPRKMDARAALEILHHIFD